MDENVAKAMARLDNAVMFKAPNADYDAYRTIRARLVELEAENDELKLVVEGLSRYDRAENADALLRECIDTMHNYLPDSPSDVAFDILEKAITAHLSENNR